MKAFVITSLCIQILGLLSNLVELGSSDPWPRTRKRTAKAEAWGLVIGLGFVAWAVYLLWGAGY